MARTSLPTRSPDGRAAAPRPDTGSQHHAFRDGLPDRGLQLLRSATTPGEPAISGLEGAPEESQALLEAGAHELVAVVARRQLELVRDPALLEDPVQVPVAARKPVAVLAPAV